MMNMNNVEIAIVGAGIAGIATAYYLCTRYAKTNVVLIDLRQPMSFTSAQSGENYRNWWPHQTMIEFTNHSIDLMEEIAKDTSNIFNMTRRGYVLATRKDNIDELIAQLHIGQEGDSDLIRFHDHSFSNSYQPPVSADWRTAPVGVDVLNHKSLIRKIFPSFDNTISHVLHIRRAGHINSQQMGQYMLEQIKASGGKLVNAYVQAIDHNESFTIEITGKAGTQTIQAEKLVNAAGPFVSYIADMLDIELPVINVLQQKIAFEDRAVAIPRQMPFSIDLDDRVLDWALDEYDLLTDDPDTAWLTKPIPGCIHCRPEGGDQGSWIKLGWAFNQTPSDAVWEPELDPQYPEVVLRGAAALNPSLQTYYGRFPRQFIHYGGYYPMTRENWPLIGPMGMDRSFIVGALSGFGTMAACAAGELCAKWMYGQALPKYAQQLSLARYVDKALMNELESLSNTGIL